MRRLPDLDEDTTVMVGQFACGEPGCPPLETVIAVLTTDGPPRRWTLHRPIDQAQDDLRILLITPSEPDQADPALEPEKECGPS
ncbi:hypothetical protein ACFHW2_34220 [Actinomadura sp. LOL_016]|uniref:hypothetical protein n=1 Tax=unclassified Actinomadura TaxID=2626254 RepID=UPI003A7F62D6